ncbi:MAG: hypothetical protein AAGA56_25835 [Myxococcota bacterium]
MAVIDGGESVRYRITGSAFRSFVTALLSGMYCCRGIAVFDSAAESEEQTTTPNQTRDGTTVPPGTGGAPEPLDCDAIELRV